MRDLSWWCGLFLLALVGAPARAALVAPDFPPVPEREMGLSEVPGHPESPAVMLYRRGDVRFRLKAGKGVITTVEEHFRLKVLTTAGLSYGEFEIEHHDWSRLEELSARTLLPDGRSLPLTGEAVFIATLSEAEDRHATRLALPGVEVGAILEIRYRLEVHSPLLLEPWVFHDDIPILHSEVNYQVPKAVIFHLVERNPSGLLLHQEESAGRRKARLVRVWAQDVPPLVEEPHGPSRLDRATLHAIVVEDVQIGRFTTQFPTTWSGLAEYMERQFWPGKRREEQAKGRAREILADLPGATRTQKADALYRFVRDRIATSPGDSFLLDEKVTADLVLERGAGTPVEKALLLTSMLEAAGLQPKLVLAARRRSGLLDPDLMILAHLQHVFLRVVVDGAGRLLDPGDSCLAFGQIDPAYEGTRMLLAVIGLKGGLAEVPGTPSADNTRHAEIELTVGGDGALTGHGRLTFTGHHAYRACSRQRESADEPALFWRRWLEERLVDFAVEEVRVDHAVDERELRLTWTMRQRATEVLGDEVMLAPSCPLGPVRQLLLLAPEQRRSMVILPFADEDTVDLRLAWPEGWEVEALPQAVEYEAEVGSFTVEVDLSEAGRFLRYQRRFIVAKPDLLPPEGYAAGRALFAAAEQSDVQALILVRR